MIVVMNKFKFGDRVSARSFDWMCTAGIITDIDEGDDICLQAMYRVAGNWSINGKKTVVESMWCDENELLMLDKLTIKSMRVVEVKTDSWFGREKEQR